MDKEQKLELIRRKTRQRLLFTVLTLVLYFSYVFNYTAIGEALGERIGLSQVTGSLVMFVCLILVFIGLEVLFLALNREDPGK